jgi:Domain of unknown function (DUF4340)
MSHRKLIILTALVVALFAFVYLFERKMPTTEESAKKGDLVWELPEDHIEAIRLERPGGVPVELARTGPASSWRLVKPDAYPADSAAVSDLLSQLARLRRSGGDSSEAKPDDYGLQSPSAKATITWKDDAKPGKRLSRTLEFGIEIPGTEATAARVAGGKSVIFVPTTVAQAARKAADEFKTKEVFPPALEAARLDVERGRGRLSLARKDGIWWLRQPVSDLAESDAVDKVIGSLTALKALEFVPAPQGQGLASFGLAPPFIHVVLADPKGPGTSVDFGATRSDGNAVYARRENQVFTVAGSIVEDLSREAEAFREPHLLHFEHGAVTQVDGAFARGSFSLARKDGGWNLAGRPLTAPSVDDLLTAILDVKSKAFADDALATALAARQPSATVTVRLSAGDPWTVKLYPGAAEARATVSGRPGAFLVAGDPVTPLEAAFRKAAAPAPAATPAPAISPTIPSVPPKK